MPRQCAVTPKDLTDSIVSKKDEILSAGRVCGPSHSVWEELSLSLDRKLSGKNLYTIVKCNRYDIHNSLGIVKVRETVEEESLDEVSIQSDGEEEDSNEKRLEFNLTLSSEEWAQLAPRDVLYKCSDKYKQYRHYEILPSGIWTEVLQKKFWEETRLPCAISFKRAKIIPDGSLYMHFLGSCKECGAVLKGRINHRPVTEVEVQIVCTFSGNFQQPHSSTSKRYLTGEGRREAIFAMTVQNVAPSMYHRLQADNLMTLGEAEPAFLPSRNALRIAKSRTLKKERLHDDTLTSILMMKYNTHFQHVIKDIGLDKFYIHYWSPSQLHVWKSYWEHCTHPSLCLDATGSLVRSLNRPFGNKSGHIFLYEATVRDIPSRLQYSVSNMLSERHDGNSIYHWLAQWIRDGAPKPKEVVCDQSVALLSACTRAFTQFPTLNEYIEHCYRMLTDPNCVVLPTCFIRCDVAHMVKLISRWSCLRGRNFRIRNLYIRSLAQVLQATEFMDVRSLLQSIFIVAFSPYEGVDSESCEETTCEKEKVNLKRRIATGTYDTEQCILEAVEKEATDVTNEVEVTDGDSFELWAEFIAKNCKDLVATQEGDHDNLQYLPEIVPYITNICRLLPLWSAVMVPLFGFGERTASSSPVENSFNDLKNHVLSHKTLPIRADVFLELHLKANEGAMKIAAAKCLSKATESSSIDRHIVPSENECHDRTQDKQPTFAQETPEKECIACADGNFPTGAHKCKTCQTPVHIFPECSVELPGTEEGYGQERLCTSCHKKLGIRSGHGNTCSQATDYVQNTIANRSPKACIACADGNFPTGAHKCIMCQTPIHIFPECSVELPGTEEGYGQERLCTSCHKKHGIRSGHGNTCSQATDYVQNTIANRSPKACIACADGNFPTGAHKCIMCQTPIHIFPECSVELPGTKEGYGQERLCISCHKKRGFRSGAGNTCSQAKDYIQSTTANRSPEACIACADGNFPSGARRCFFCNIPVHLLPGCSLEVSDKEEGSRQAQLCITCSQKDLNTLRTQKREAGALENWRGLAVPPKKRKRDSYLEPQAELEHLNLKSKISVRKIGLLKNGNRSSDLKAVKMQGYKEKFSISNTCAFDTLVQLLASAICDSKDFQCFVSQVMKKQPLFKLAQSLVKQGISAQTYKLRAEILLTFCEPVSLPSKIAMLSFEATITEMIKKLRLPHPCVVEKTSCSSPICSATKVVQRHVLVVSIPGTLLHVLEGRVLRSISAREDICNETRISEEGEATVCRGLRRTQCQLSMYLLIELVNIPSDFRAESDIALDVTSRLSEIPKTLKLEKLYHLRGCAAFSGSGKDINVVGHYVAHCYRPNNCWEVYNDLLDKKYSVKSENSVNSQLLLYTI